MPASVSRSFSRTLIDPAHRPRRLGLGADLGNGMGRTLVAGEWNAALYPPLAAAVGSLDKHLDKDRSEFSFSSLFFPAVLLGVTSFRYLCCGLVVVPLGFARPVSHP